MTHRNTVTAGIDIGSLTADVVIFGGGEILAFTIVPTLSNSEAAAISAYESALDLAKLREEEVADVVACFVHA